MAGSLIVHLNPDLSYQPVQPGIVYLGVAILDPLDQGRKFEWQRPKFEWEFFAACKAPVHDRNPARSDQKFGSDAESGGVDRSLAFYIHGLGLGFDKRTAINAPETHCNTFS